MNQWDGGDPQRPELKEAEDYIKANTVVRGDPTATIFVSALLGIIFGTAFTFATLMVKKRHFRCGTKSGEKVRLISGEIDARGAPSWLVEGVDLRRPSHRDSSHIG